MLACVAPLAPSAQTSPDDALRAALDARVKAIPGSGIALAVSGDSGKTMFAGTSGTSRRLDAATIFEIGSVTKTFTATILASMVLDGSVKLSDPVEAYVPASVHVPSGPSGRKITLLDLATQHSGLPRLPTNLNPQDPANPYADYTLPDLYAFLTSYKLTRDPGARYEYSNLGFGLLGIALANREHTTYAKLLRQRVLDPLGMHDTDLATSFTKDARFAKGGSPEGNAVSPWTQDAIASAGGIRSNLGDMLKYARCNMGVGPLAAACLFAQQPRSDYTGHKIGLAWYSDDANGIVHHGGDTYGYHASVAIASDRKTAVVVLANGGLPVDDIGVSALDPRVTVVQAEPIVRPEPAALEAYTGSFGIERAPAGITMSIARVDDRLTAQLTGQVATPLYPAGPDTFESHIVNARFVFSRDAHGAVNGFVLYQNGIALTATKPGIAAAAIVVPTPSPEPAFAVDPSTLASYAGTYSDGDSVNFVATVDGNKLMLRLDDQPSFEVFPVSADHFSYKVVAARIVFERDAAGAVNDLVLHQNGRILTAIKEKP
jgi:CubicO group peptidase (beta-lactamase class C family)